jgi:hypothetical protein
MKDTNPLSEDVSSETSPQSVLSLDAYRRAMTKLMTATAVVQLAERGNPGWMGPSGREARERTP